MRFLFCTDPLAAHAPDSVYATEVAAVVQEGGTYDLLSFERLVSDHDPLAATHRVRPADASEQAIYRGWMLRPDQYRQLYTALCAKGLHLINTPQAYRHCHYLPESYPLIQTVTPHTVWLPYDSTTTMDQVMTLLAPFHNRPIILKDFVKSRKHEWHEACYIPQANDQAAVERVVACFVERQADDLNEGLVFRAYMPFQPIGQHPTSTLPLTCEYRCFILDGRVIITSAYWDSGTYPVGAPPVHHFADIIQQIRSRFFTMDIAQCTDGTWMIVELGDAQVAGLPETLDPTDFYHTLMPYLQQAETTIPLPANNPV